MNLQEELKKYVARVDSLNAKRIERERQVRDMSNTVLAGNLSRLQRNVLPVERERVLAQIAEIDDALAAATRDRRTLNDWHLASSRQKAAQPATADVKKAAAQIGELENKQEVLASVRSRLENDRTSVLLDAVTGDARAKSDAARLAKEIGEATQDSADVAAALVTGRHQLAAAQVTATDADLAKRSNAGRMIGNEAAADAEEFDRLLTQAVEILDRRHARTNELLKLGAINSSTVNRIRNQRVVISALVRAGMKRHIKDLSSVGGSASLADTDRALFPTQRAPKAA